MTKEEIIKKIEELENKKFNLAMTDVWNKEDFEADLRWRWELKQLRAELKKI